MDSTDQLVDINGGDTVGKWVSLTCDSDLFDIDCGQMRCDYSTAGFMATVHGDAIVVVPAMFRFASQMIAHAVLPGRNNGHVKITVRRLSVRCARLYRFAYVDGRRYEVMGVSGTFAFAHNNGPCDCGTETYIIGDTGNDEETESPMTTTSDHPAADPVGMSSFISSLMDTRSSAPQCSACKGPSNYRQVLEYLTKNIDYLSNIDSNIDGKRKKKTECLNNCNLILEYLKIKTKMLNREMENSRRFVDGLVISLLNNRKAIFRTSDKTIFVKTDKTCESNYSTSERFMDSIINSQKQMIANLTTTYKEISIMMNTMQLFTKVL